MKNKEFRITNELLASSKQRLLNFILDLFIIYVICNSIGTIATLFGEISNNYTYSNLVESFTLFEKLIWGFVTMFWYYFLTEMYFSRTIAKYFTKTFVITKEGLKPTFKAIVRRTLYRFIPFECLTYLGGNVRGLHDFSSDTYVVRKHEFNKIKGVDLFP